MTGDKVKVTTTITVKKEFTLDEGELEALLEEHGRKVLGTTKPVSVRIEVNGSGRYVDRVSFTLEESKEETV